MATDEYGFTEVSEFGAARRFMVVQDQVEEEYLVIDTDLWVVFDRFPSLREARAQAILQNGKL